MNSTQLPSAKAQTVEERSDAIIVSFNSGWRQRLLDKEFSLIIRKRIPTTSAPKWLYFHLNAPISAICARAEISWIGKKSLSYVMGHSTELGLERSEIKAYVGRDSTVGVYELGEIEIAPAEAKMTQIQSKLNYSPPQSFLLLSQQGQKLIDSMCSFSTRRA